MYFLKWFLIYLLMFAGIVYGLCIYAMGLHNLSSVFFDDILRDILMISAPAFMCALSKNGLKQNRLSKNYSPKSHNKRAYEENKNE